MPHLTTEISQTTSSETLLTLFGSAARVAVLRVFMLDPTREYYQRQLEAATGLAIRAVQRELERLTAIGLLYRRIEGNRAYYQADQGFPLFHEIRGIFLKTATDTDQVRGALATDEAVRLCFVSQSHDRMLIVTHPGKRPAFRAADGLAVEMMHSDAFLRALQDSRSALEPFLLSGFDLLGRRDDVIWRHIEAAGYNVAKGEGVP